MKLSKVIISNFKKVENLTLETEALNFELSKPNEYGKSSIADAIFWVMTGKLLSGSSDIQTIKPTSDTSKLVEVELIFDNGTSLKRTYQEKRTRTRGTTIETLTGHETKTYINGESVQVTKFENELNLLLGIKFEGKYKGNLIQVITDPLFLGLKEKWETFRTLIIDVVGNVTDKDVFDTDKKFSPLLKIITKHNGKLDEVKKIFNAQLKDLKSQEETLIAQISVLKESQFTPVENYEKALKQLEEIDKKIDDLKAKKNLSEKELIQDRDNKLSSLRNSYNESKENDLKIYNETFSQRNKDLEQARQSTEQCKKDFSKINNEISGLNIKLTDIERERKRTLTEITDLNQSKKDLTDEFYSVRDTEFTTHDNLICPNCNHDLNGEKVMVQKERFNLNKADKLKDIQTRGKKMAEIIVEKNEKIEELKRQESIFIDEIESLKPKVTEYNAELIELTAKEAELSKSIKPFEQSKETALIKDKMGIMTNNSPQYSQKYDDDISDYIKAKITLQEIVNQYNMGQINIKKANELQVKLDGNIEDSAKYEQLNALLNEFIKIKLDLLNKRVEAVFGGIKFKLVESNIKEGSWNEVCYVTHKDVPYPITNSARKITLGIQVCEAIRKHLKITDLPYIIDNGEQITDRQFTKYTQSQTITFLVDDGVTPVELETNLFNI